MFRGRLLFSSLLVLFGVSVGWVLSGLGVGGVAYLCGLVLYLLCALVSFLLVGDFELAVSANLIVGFGVIG